MITDDPTHPGINKVREDGQNEAYLVLSEEERAKGFIRPYRDSYIHVGLKSTYPLRDLDAEELERYKPYGYVKFEEYPESESPLTGRFWTKEQLKSCGSLTKMGRALSETYARNPKFYGATYCCGCGKHFPVNEFVWAGTNEVLGS